jgi:hypothetical protein
VGTTKADTFTLFHSTTPQGALASAYLFGGRIIRREDRWRIEFKGQEYGKERLKIGRGGKIWTHGWVISSPVFNAI